MADRVGVINHGRIVLVDEKAALIRKLGKRRLTLVAAEAAAGAAQGTGGLAARTRGRRPSPLLSLLCGSRGHRRADAFAPPQRDRRRFQGSRHQHNHARGHFRRSRGARGVTVSAINLSGVWSIYRSEMQRTQRTILQSVATPVITTALYFIVFGAAIGGRIREVSGVSYGAFIVPGLMMLSLLTQSISNASIGIYFPKFTGPDLRAPLGADIRDRGGLRLCRRRGDQVDRHRPHHSHNRRAVGAAAHRASVLDDRLSRADLDRLQPVRLHHRHLGQELRAARRHPFAGGDAAHVSRRRLLFDRHVAAVLARGQSVQSRGLSDQRLSLEFLWPGATSASARASASRRCSSPSASRFWHGSSAPDGA